MLPPITRCHIRNKRSQLYRIGDDVHWSQDDGNVVAPETIDALYLIAYEPQVARVYVVGFTGTMDGANERQLVTLKTLITNAYDRAYNAGRLPVFVHGDCIGADAQAAHMAWRSSFIPIARPGCAQDGSQPSTAHTPFNAYVFPPERYLMRDLETANECDEMIAVAGRNFNNPRSGTGTTVRYARQARKPVQVIGLDGTVTLHTPELEMTQ